MTIIEDQFFDDHDLSLKIDVVITSEIFNNLRNLTHLSLDFQLYEEFFESIDKYLPKLQSIELEFHSDITEQTFKSLSKLSKLQTIKFKIYSVYKFQFNESVINGFIRKSPKIKSIYCQNLLNKIDLNEKSIFDVKNGKQIKVFEII